VAEARRVFVHIGAPKTGTTYLQQVLYANRELLAHHGVLYPDLGLDAHHTAAWSLRPAGDGAGFDASRFRGTWERLVDQVNGWSGQTAVISTEMFVFFDPELASTVLAGFDGAEMHVIYTARDLVRQVPAVWQEQVKNQKTQPYRGFVRDVVGPCVTSMAKHFWRAQDAPNALARWSGGLDPTQVHVITAPPAGAASTLLWERFAQVIGVDGTAYDTPIPPANTSLSVAAAEVLRRYNDRHGGDMSLQRYRRVVKRPLMPALVEGVADRSKLPLSRLQRRLLVRKSGEIVEGLREAGYDVVGSLDELIPEASERSSSRRGGRGPDGLSDAEVVDALLDVVHHMLEERRQEARRQRRTSAAASAGKQRRGAQGPRGRVGRQR
jgi:hypothetical protein